MRSYSLIPAHLALLCFVAIMTTASAIAVPAPGCTPTGNPSPYAAGDAISLTGPSPTSAEQNLGVTYTYYWYVESRSSPTGTGTSVNIGDPTSQSITINVPSTSPPPYYYVDLLVTTAHATGCVAESCMLFALTSTQGCTITGSTGPICITNSTALTYSVSTTTPTGMQRGWWIIAPGGSAPTSWGGQFATGTSCSITWSSAATSGTGSYTVWTGLFSSHPPRAYQQGTSCSEVVAVVPIPQNTISVS